MSKIEWTDVTWNPVTGCDKVSQGCKNCYAEIMHRRLMHIAPHKYTKPFIGNIEMHHDVLEDLPKKGKRIFVNSMSDLFHKDVRFDFIDLVYGKMGEYPQHTFQILTKRPDIMLEFYKERCPGWMADGVGEDAKHIWPGVSCEDQKTANERIPLLLQIPAAVRFLSCEPLLGPIDFSKVDYAADSMNVLSVDYLLDWVIVGGESGHNARPMHPDWVRSLRNQCKAADVPFFFKQWGEYVDNQNMPVEWFRGNYKKHVFGTGYFSTEVWKVGKSKSGNVLDGVQHLNFPSTK